ncbi:MAG: SMC-Scp complex subunit ScpB [Candidatus Bathyarchaeota archaeon]
MDQTSPSDESRSSLDIEDLPHKRSLVEASLYVAGHPLELKTLCSITGISSKRKVQAIAEMLVDDYRNRNSALEIVKLEDNRFVMQLKHQYVQRVRRLSIRPLLKTGPLKTLSYVAYRQPVPQAKVVLIRGGQAYDHLKQLLEMGLVSREKLGKTQLLRTTDIFSDYFNLSKDLRLMKRQLEAILSQIEEKSRKTTDGEKPTSGSTVEGEETKRD